jgi:hypothetical protein
MHSRRHNSAPRDAEWMVGRHGGSYCRPRRSNQQQLTTSTINNLQPAGHGVAPLLHRCARLESTCSDGWSPSFPDLQPWNLVAGTRGTHHLQAAARLDPQPQAGNPLPPPLASMLIMNTANEKNTCIRYDYKKGLLTG